MQRAKRGGRGEKKACDGSLEKEKHLSEYGIVLFLPSSWIWKKKSPYMQGVNEVRREKESMRRVQGFRNGGKEIKHDGMRAKVRKNARKKNNNNKYR